MKWLLLGEYRAEWNLRYVGFGVRQNPKSTNGDATLNRLCSIFSQLLKLMSRLEFDAASEKHQAERHARGFSSWAQMIAMLFCQLGHAQSLREITADWPPVKGSCAIWGLGAAEALDSELCQ